MRAPLVGSVILAGCACAAAIIGLPPTKAGCSDTFIVHEWGTFLSVQGSDGVTLGGMVDSEDHLPPFVQERSLNGHSRAKMFQKGETPVTYFYVDRPRSVEVRVGLPQGLLTHWYPKVRAFGPPLSPKVTKPPVGSYIDWGRVDLIPNSRPTGTFRDVNGMTPVGAEHAWRFARETDSAFVRVGRQIEKFLFYRGLGTFQLPLQVTSSGTDSDLHLTLHNRGVDSLHGLFVIRIEKGAIQYRALDDLPSGGTRRWDGLPELAAVPLKVGVPLIKQEVASVLVHAGLYPKEAQAMVNTWENSYFRNEGMRILYVLPRKNVDEHVPLQIRPAPDQLTRVMVGRIEVLTPSMEKRLEKAVAGLDAADLAVRQNARAELTRLGRLEEPVLRRIAMVTASQQVRARAERLVQTMGQETSAR